MEEKNMEKESGYVCMKQEESIYKIGLFAQMNKVTIKTLRHYDDIGLLKPARIDENNGYRYYTSAQLPTLHQIIALRQMGMTLDEIAKVQKGMSVENLLMRKRAELMRVIAEETMKLSQVEYYLSNKEKNSDYHVILKKIPEVIVASKRIRISNYEALNEEAPKMGHEMEVAGCVCAIPEYCFNLYHDEEYRGENIDVEICEAVTEMKKDTKTLKFKKMPHVETAACVLHKGSYENLPKAYSALIQWMEENEFVAIEGPRESYIDGIWNKDSKEEWLTEIQFSVRKKSEQVCF